MSLLLVCGVDQTPVWWWSVESWKENCCRGKTVERHECRQASLQAEQLIHDAIKAAYSMPRALDCVRVTNMGVTQNPKWALPLLVY
jgi:hypothetical protein